ncbi:DUF397 domain-containing protein [Actinomadura sp. WMMA1423]|uniref:DUF397 domain-containing protein n=1 Tax=Actinomadura sp. WMMA1423 TaxID=2591108 RepID=UPI00114645A7|nr:DUF397 domain-containing protein [Actinomadura sp. WMMA1423]
MAADHTPEPALSWRKSRHSTEGDCVEVAARSSFPDRDTAVIFVRDSKHAIGGNICIEGDAWNLFVAQVKEGAFDL